jgi:hypothetical protein
MLEMIKRKAGMNVLYWRLKNSLDEIKTKHPERLDLIKPMEISLTEVAECIEYLNFCDKVTRATNGRNHDLQLENLKLKQENSSLTKHVNNLLQGL